MKPVAIIVDDPPGHVCDLGDEARARIEAWWREVMESGAAKNTSGCGRRFQLTLGERAVSVVEEAGR